MAVIAEVGRDGVVRPTCMQYTHAGGHNKTAQVVRMAAPHEGREQLVCNDFRRRVFAWPDGSPSPYKMGAGSKNSGGDGGLGTGGRGGAAQANRMSIR